MTTIVSEMPIATPQQSRQAEEAAATARSRITMPGGQKRDSLAAKLLVAQKDDVAEAEASTDLLIQGLVERLPKPNGVWPLDDRSKWLKTAVSIFDLVYKADEGEPRQIDIVCASHDSERAA